MKTDRHLSRRERQILDVVYQRGRATAAEILAALPDPPSYSAVRALLRILEVKKHLQHEEKGRRYVYFPTVPRRVAELRALMHVVQTFFKGSDLAAASKLAMGLSDEDLDRLEAVIERARREGR